MMRGAGWRIVPCGSAHPLGALIFVGLMAPSLGPKGIVPRVLAAWAAIDAVILLLTPWSIFLAEARRRRRGGESVGALRPGR